MDLRTEAFVTKEHNSYFLAQISSVAMLQKLHYDFFKSSVALVEANEGDTEAIGGGTALPWLTLDHVSNYFNFGKATQGFSKAVKSPMPS